MAARTRSGSRQKVGASSARSWDWLDCHCRADHGSGKTERAESVGKRGAPRLAAFPVDRRVPIDRFAESDEKAGGNDLANGETQRNLVAEADERGVGRGGSDFWMRFWPHRRRRRRRASRGGVRRGRRNHHEFSVARRREADGRHDQAGQAHENLHRDYGGKPNAARTSTIKTMVRYADIALLLCWFFMVNGEIGRTGLS